VVAVSSQRWATSGVKTEHAGAKNGGAGGWVPRFEAKRAARRKRRELDKRLARVGQAQPR